MMLHVQTFGEGDQNLIVLHGFLGMGANWKSHARNWSSLGYRIHLVDQRNHGKSFRSSEFNYGVMCEDLRRLMEHLQIKDAFLLGHSMGGKTAMEFACRYPQYVRALAVVDIGAKCYPPHHQKILEGLAALDLDSLKSRAEADAHLQAYVPELGIRQFLLKNLYWKNPGQLDLYIHIDVLKNAGQAIGKALDSDAYFEKSTLFISGGQSDYILPEDKPILHQHFPNVQMTAIPVAGHWPHAEQPVAFSETLLQWLKQV